MSELAESGATDHVHDQVPADPVDGTRFECALCGVAFVYVDLDDGQPGEWVGVTP